MNRRYASATAVSPDRSRTEIEHTLQRYGADQFAYGWNEGGAMIGFRFKRWLVRFQLPLPSEEDAMRTPKGRTRRKHLAAKAKDQEIRRRWRSLALAIKAKLDTVETGITTFETEFLPYIMLPNGQTAGEWLAPQLEKLYDKGEMPRGLLMLPAPKKTAEVA